MFFEHSYTKISSLMLNLKWYISTETGSQKFFCVFLIYVCLSDCLSDCHSVPLFLSWRSSILSISIYRPFSFSTDLSDHQLPVHIRPLSLSLSLALALSLSLSLSLPLSLHLSLALSLSLSLSLALSRSLSRSHSHSH